MQLLGATNEVGFVVACGIVVSVAWLFGEWTTGQSEGWAAFLISRVSGASPRW